MTSDSNSGNVCIKRVALEIIICFLIEIPIHSVDLSHSHQHNRALGVLRLTYAFLKLNKIYQLKEIYSERHYAVGVD